jgi:ATP-binding cassette subfamily C (CFTR/MRP) protein 1
VEAKRLDSILRSKVYAAVSGQLRSQTYGPILKLSLSESLSGLATVRAYRDEERFISKLDNGIDGESYFYISFESSLHVRRSKPCVLYDHHSSTMVRYPIGCPFSFRRDNVKLKTILQTLGNILVLGISLFAVGFRKTVNPSKIGVVLSYALSSKPYTF